MLNRPSSCVNRVADGFEDFQRFVGRLVRPVDQEHFLLGADALHAGFDQPRIQHRLEGIHLRQQGFHERLVRRFVFVQPDVLLAHGFTQSPVDAPRIAHRGTIGRDTARRVIMITSGRVLRQTQQGVGQHDFRHSVFLVASASYRL